jgi:carbonic anhydrase/acetyltransferase-like protein (isoleucine patch superfamily)
VFPSHDPTGAGNTAVGKDALRANTTASNNTAVGLDALTANTTGDTNTAVGKDSMLSTTTGTNNSAFGARSLDANTTGTNNVAVGDMALGANTTANNNTAVGTNALYSNTTAGQNVAIGRNAMYVNTTGSENTAVGDEALKANTTGGENTAVGGLAGDAITTGGSTTCIGYGAGTNITTASHNLCVGQSSGLSITTNAYNTIIGTHANTKGDNTTDQYQIALGYDVESVGASFFTFGTGTGSDRVYNQYTSNNSWTRVSDERYKKEIQDNTDCGLDFINDLRPVTFKWKEKAELDPSFPDYDAQKTNDAHPDKLYGLIAQEVKTALDKHNITDFGGWSSITNGDHTHQGVSQEMFIHPLIKAVQELSTALDAALARITTLEG